MNMPNLTMSLTNHKRRLVEVDSDSETEVRKVACHAGVEGAWPRFLVVEGADPALPLDRLSPFAVEKGFQAISSTGFKDIKRQKSGAFLVECSTKRASDFLLKKDSCTFVDRQIKVSVHPYLNSSKGIIRCRELKDVSEGEIKANLANQGVIRVEKAFISKEGRKEPTNTIFLTFAMTKLPEIITVGYLRVKVVPYIPSPLRCFKCQRYGHSSRSCKSAETCRDCGQAKHEGECVGPKYCLNCQGSHSANSRDCPVWKREQEIQRIKTTERCSFVEAKRRVEALKPTLGKTFSEVASASCSKTSSEPLTNKLELVLEKIVQSLSVMTANMNAIMKALSIQAQPTTLAVPPSTSSSETGQATRSESSGISRHSRQSGSHSGRRETAASNKVNDASAAQNTTANSGSKVSAKKPLLAPKPKKHDDKVDPDSKIPTRNKFDVLAGLDMEVESAPSLDGSRKSTTSPSRKLSPRKEGKEKK